MAHEKRQDSYVIPTYRVEVDYLPTEKMVPNPAYIHLTQIFRGAKYA